LRETQQGCLVMIIRENSWHAGQGVQKLNRRDKDEPHTHPAM